MAHFIHDEKNNRIEGLSKEEIYALLAAAIQQGQLPSVDDDTAFVTMFKSIVDGKAYKMAFCTQAQYNQLEAQGLLVADAYYIITDDTTYDDLVAYIEQVETTANNTATQLSNLVSKNSGSLFGRIINIGDQILLIVSDDLGINSVSLVIDGTNNKILARKVVNNVIEKEYDLFTEISNEINNRIPLTEGDKDDAITYAGLYEFKQDTSNVTHIMSINPITDDHTIYEIRQIYSDISGITAIDKISFDKTTKKFTWTFKTPSTENTVNFTWKLLIKY